MAKFMVVAEVVEDGGLNPEVIRQALDGFKLEFDVVVNNDDGGPVEVEASVLLSPVVEE
jgi:hypothetical protein